MTVDRANVFDAAKELVYKDRGKHYGHPSEDFAKAAKMMTGVLMDELKPGVEIPVWKVGLLMICIKMSRECKQHTYDNVTDMAGYAETVRMCREG